MGLLDGKKLLVTGVLTDSSIAFHAARLAQEEGAQVVLSSFGRQMKLTQAFAKRLPTAAPVVELDVTDQAHLDGLADAVREHVDTLDGVVHSIGFAPQSVMGGNFLSASWEDVATALQVSTFSYKSLATAAKPLMTNGGALVEEFNARCGDEDCWQLAGPLAYFIPEHAVDPSRTRPGETLWAEVTLPPTGAPRPIRLGLKRGEAIEPVRP